jgi:hypothetical protein
MAVELSHAQASQNDSASRPSRVIALHLAIGGSTLAAFLASGAYMRSQTPPISSFEPGLHALFTSRHIYILAAALLNLVLAAYMQPAARRGARAVQWVGSLLLSAAAALLTAAFVVEPMNVGHRTPVSSFGLYGLFAGALLHVGAALRDKLSAR